MVFLLNDSFIKLAIVGGLDCFVSLTPVVSIRCYKTHSTPHEEPWTNGVHCHLRNRTKTELCWTKQWATIRAASSLFLLKIELFILGSNLNKRTKLRKRICFGLKIAYKRGVPADCVIWACRQRVLETPLTRFPLDKLQWLLKRQSPLLVKALMLYQTCLPRWVWTAWS